MFDFFIQVKASAGGYAFMMESAAIAYIVERECDLGNNSVLTVFWL